MAIVSRGFQGRRRQLSARTLDDVLSRDELPALSDGGRRGCVRTAISADRLRSSKLSVARWSVSATSRVKTERFGPTGA